MTNNNTERFLQLEDRANDLVAQLEQLARAVESYKVVSKDLADASQGLSNATEQYQAIASEVGQVAVTMRQVGMPDLLDAVAGVRQEVHQTVITLTDQQRRHASQTKRLVIIGALLATAAGAVAAVLPLLNLST